MIRIGDKWIRPESVDAIERPTGILDPDNWTKIFVRGEWIMVNSPAAVVADRIALAEACRDVHCTEDHDG